MSLSCVYFMHIDIGINKLELIKFGSGDIYNENFYTVSFDFAIK